MPVVYQAIILVTEEPEFRMIMVGGQSREVVRETSSWKYPTKNRVGGVDQQVEHLPSKHGS
jgi:hypothetical protein